MHNTSLRLQLLVMQVARSQVIRALPARPEPGLAVTTPSLVSPVALATPLQKPPPAQRNATPSTPAPLEPNTPTRLSGKCQSQSSNVSVSLVLAAAQAKESAPCAPSGRLPMVGPWKIASRVLSASPVPLEPAVSTNAAPWCKLAPSASGLRLVPFLPRSVAVTRASAEETSRRMLVLFVLPGCIPRTLARNAASPAVSLARRHSALPGTVVDQVFK
jgi:hypothetical protein